MFEIIDFNFVVDHTKKKIKKYFSTNQTPVDFFDHVIMYFLYYYIVILNK